jgi:hypothetical protein
MSPLYVPIAAKKHTPVSALLGTPRSANSFVRCDALYPLESESVLSAPLYPRAVSRPFLIEHNFEPSGVAFTGVVDVKAADLGRYHPQREKLACRRIDIGEVH